jgi:hypothetical protein
MVKHILFIVFLFISFSGKSQTGVITTICGNGTPGETGDGNAAISAEISATAFGIFDPFGNYYFSDNNNNIRKISSSGVINTVAGTGGSGFSGDGGPANLASLSSPKELAFDSEGNLYIADDGNIRIRKVSVGTGIINTFAGNGTFGNSGDGGLATAASFGNIGAVCVDPYNNVYIGDVTYNVIRKVDTLGIVSTVAGTAGVIGITGDGGPGTSATLGNIMYLSSDKVGNIYISCGNVRKLNVSTGIITKIAGNDAVEGYTGENILADTSEIAYPFAMGFNENGELFLAERDNNRIRKIDTNGFLHTVAGTGIAGYTGDGSTALSAEIDWPEGIAFDACGNLYFNDLENYRIREVVYNTGLATITLSGDTSVAAGSSVSLAAAITGSGIYMIHWYKNGTLVSATTTPSFTYTMTSTADTITATVVSAGGCFDSVTSAPHIVTPVNTAVSNVVASGVFVYPNPAHNSIVVRGSIVNAFLSNAIGQRLLGQRSTGHETVMDISTLPAGVYLLTVTGSDDTQSVRKIIKE